MADKYYDLNVIDQGNFVRNLENLKQLTKLGYNIVALNRSFLYPNKAKKETDFAPYTPTIEALQKALNKDTELASLKLKPVKVLSRITIPISEVGQFGILKGVFYRRSIKDADIVAMRPGNERIVKMIAEHKTVCDIIALNLEEKLDFIPKFKTLREAVENGISWEICYSPAIRSTSSRKYIFRYGVDIVERAKHGKGIIFSSGGEHIMDFRSPHDVMNLANLFILKGDERSKVISTNPKNTVQYSETRHFTTHNAMIVEKIKEDKEEEISSTVTPLNAENEVDAGPSKKKRKKR